MSRGIKSIDRTDHIYYNAIIDNTEIDGLVINYVDSRNDPILDKASDYSMSIVRFSVPAGGIPIFVFQTNTYYITLSYNGIEFKQVIVYESYSDILPPVITNDLKSAYYYVYSMDQMVKMINTTFAAALVGLKLLPGTGAIAAANPPVLRYNQDTKRISIWFETAFYRENLATPIQVYINAGVEQFFDGLPLFFESVPPSVDMDFRFIVRDTGFNSLTAGGASNVYPVVQNPFSYAVIVMESEYMNYPNWFSGSRLVFTTTIPVINEYIPSETSISAGLQSTSSSSLLPILTDFTLTLENIDQNSGTINYLPTAEYRRVDLSSDEPLSQIDFRIFWFDSYNNQHEFFIPINSSVNVKFLFEKKKGKALKMLESFNH